jgi:heme a synthase
VKLASDHTLTPGERWPHRFAWVLLCAIFPLIWIGGAVTTYHAGMSVPDWPTTYGSWFYPIHLWRQVWDLFLEHSHREWARWVVGTSTLALVAAIWLQERRKWMRWMAVAVLVGVCIQAVLGGFRVLCDDLLLARVHACTAPVVFALVAAMVSVTSRPWLACDAAREHPAARRLGCLAPAIVAAVYLEIVLGTQLRHPPIGLGPGWFQFCVWAKVIAAGLIAAAVAWLLVDVPRSLPDEPILVRRVRILAIVLAAQLVLAAATWITHYDWPLWFKNYIWSVSYNVHAAGWLQVNATNLHVVFGSLTLIAATTVMLWTFRLLREGGSP